MTETHTPLSNAETAAFCSQIAMILRSGISSIEGISIMLEDTTEPEEKRLLESINTMLLNTGSLHLALEDTHAFPDYMIQMVQIGEQAGKLDEVMTSLADYYEKEAALNQTIHNAVTYPLLMIFMMILVILVLVTRVMPIFNQVFAQLGREMSGLSLGILRFGQFLNAHIVVCGIVLVLLAAGLPVLDKTWTPAAPWIYGKTSRRPFSSGSNRRMSFCKWYGTDFKQRTDTCGMSETLHSTYQERSFPHPSGSLLRSSYKWRRSVRNTSFQSHFLRNLCQNGIHRF